MRLDGVNVMTQSRVDKISDNIAFVNGEKIVAEKILICVGRRTKYMS